MSRDDPADDITDGALVGPMLRLAWPIVVIQLLQVAYNIADTLWLGRYSTDAVGAISLGFPLVFLLISVAGGFTTAAAILVAQYTGADSEGSAGVVVGTALTFVLALAVVLGITGHLLTDDMVNLLPGQSDTAANVFPLAAAYLEVLFLGLPFLFGFFVFSSVMRGYGDTRTPMRVMAISVGLNVVLDPILIFGWGPAPRLGIVGAAVATVFSRGVATALGLYVLFVAPSGPDVGVGQLRPDLGTIREIVDLGVPSTIEQSAAAVAMITLTAVVVTFEPPVVAAYGLGNRLISLVFLPAMGLGQATNTMVGQNLGAERPDRAERAAWLAAGTSAGVMLGVAVIAAAFARPIVGAFMATGTEDAAATIAHGTEYLRTRSIEFAFIGLMQVLLGAFRGAGNTRTAMLFSMITLWVARVPTVYYLAIVADWGPTGVWIGMTTGHVVGGVLTVLWFTRGTWKRAVIDETGDRSVAGAEE